MHVWTSPGELHGTVKCRYNADQFIKILLTHSTAIIAAEHESDLKLTRDTPYLALMGELWGVSSDDIGENWLHYNGTALYKENGSPESPTIAWPTPQPPHL